MTRGTTHGSAWDTVRVGPIIGGDGDAREPQAATFGDAGIAIVYHDPQAPEKVTLAVTGDGGDLFAFKRFHTRTQNAREYVVAARDERIAVAWVDNGADDRSHMLFASSIDGGRSFQKYGEIGPVGTDQREPLFTIDSADNLHLIWRTDIAIHRKTTGYTMRSHDWQTWEAPIAIDPTTATGRQWGMSASDNGHLYTTYLRQDSTRHWWPQLAISTDYGETWGTPRLLGDKPIAVIGRLGGEAHAPRIWAAGSQFAAVYDQGGIITMRNSRDYGVTLLTARSLSAGADALITARTALWRGAGGSVNIATGGNHAAASDIRD